MITKSILIIDNDLNLRLSMALVLRRANYRVDTAGSASEALADLESSHYDLIIIDILMPDESSILLPRLLELYPGLSILVLTSQTSPQTRSETIHAGFHSRLTKPVTPETLLKQVKSILEKKPSSPHGHYEKLLLR